MEAVYFFYGALATLLVITILSLFRDKKPTVGNAKQTPTIPSYRSISCAVWVEPIKCRDYELSLNKTCNRLELKHNGKSLTWWFDNSNDTYMKENVLPYAAIINTLLEVRRSKINSQVDDFLFNTQTEDQA